MATASRDWIIGGSGTENDPYILRRSESGMPIPGANMYMPKLAKAGKPVYFLKGKNLWKAYTKFAVHIRILTDDEFSRLRS